MVSFHFLLAFLLLMLARLTAFSQPPPDGLLDVKELPKNRYLVTLRNHTGDTLRMLSPYWHTTATHKRFYWIHFTFYDFTCDRRRFFLYKDSSRCMRTDSLIFPAEIDTPIKIIAVDLCGDGASDTTGTQISVRGGHRRLFWHNIPPHSSFTFRVRSLNKEPLYYFRIAMRSTRTREEYIFERTRPFRPLEAGPPY